MNQQTTITAAPAAMPRMLTTSEAAAHLGVAKNTMEKWRLYGDGPAFIRISAHCIRYDPADLEAYVAARRGFSTGELGSG
jgi:hypothetical protein